MNSNLERLTCGQLIRLVVESQQEESDLISALKSAAGKRNELVHGYFYRRAKDMYSEHGHEEILKELASMIQLFERAIDLLEQSQKLSRVRRRLNPRRIEEEMLEMLKSAPES